MSHPNANQAPSGGDEDGVFYWSRAPVDGTGARGPRRQYSRSMSGALQQAPPQPQPRVVQPPPSSTAMAPPPFPTREPLQHRRGPVNLADEMQAAASVPVLEEAKSPNRSDMESGVWRQTKGFSPGRRPANGTENIAPVTEATGSNKKRKALLYGAGLAAVAAAVLITLMVIPDSNIDKKGLPNVRSKKEGSPTTGSVKANINFEDLKVPTILPNNRVAVPYTDGLTLSRVSYGNLRFIEFEANGDYEGIEESVKTALDAGVTTFDTSDIYGWYGVDGEGRSNELFAEVLLKNPGMRERMELVCKFDIRLEGGWYHLDTSREWILRSVDRYLERFNTTYLDVLMLHNPPDDKMDPEEVAEAFKTVYKEEKVKMFGISNYKKKDYLPLKKAMEERNMRLSVSEVETSVLHPEKIIDGLVDYFANEGMVVLGWGPVGGDPMGGKNLLFFSDGEREKKIVKGLEEKARALGGQADEVAMAYLLHNPSPIIPIIGSTKMDRIKRQAKSALGLRFSNKDYKDIADLVAVADDGDM